MQISTSADKRKSVGQRSNSIPLVASARSCLLPGWPAADAAAAYPVAADMLMPFACMENGRHSASKLPILLCSQRPPKKAGVASERQ